MASGEKMRPSEKAPKILDIEDPSMLPNARGDWRWETAAITTTSFQMLVVVLQTQKRIGSPLPIQHQLSREQSRSMVFVNVQRLWQYDL